MGITLRTALWSWLVTLTTLLIFVLVIIPQQKRTFLENLESKAQGIAVSLRDVAAGAVVNEDFSSVVDHCKGMLQGDKVLDHLVITKNDGFSLINERAGWRSESNAGREWRPDKREPTSGIGGVPLFNRRVFHYSQPFDYSGIQWGWLHVGLSLEGYDRSVATVYHRTMILVVLCILLSLGASLVYAKRLVQPILNLQGIVKKVASGDLSVRAEIDRRDELGSLADSTNLMTEALLRGDKILQSVRFAAQEFLSSNDWNEIIRDVLAKIGEAAAVSRIRVFENRFDEQGSVRAGLDHEWVAPGLSASPDPPGESKPTLNSADFALWTQELKQGRFITANVSELDEAPRRKLESTGIRSVIATPILVEHSWWGILTLVDCQNERHWTEAEQDSFRAIADMLGATITRQRTQEALLEAKQTLEHRVQERTRELREQVAATRRSEADKETILATAQIGIIIVDQDTHRIRYLNTTAQRMAGRTQESLLDKYCHLVICPAEKGKCPVSNLHQSIDQSERVLLNERGDRIPILKSVGSISYEGRPCLIESFLDLTERKQSEQVVENLHRELLVASRQAGMAEVATGVLHNVGNVLNSVNVSCTLIADRIRQSKVSNFAKAAQFLQEHQTDLGAYLTHDPKGKLLPSYLIELAPHLVKEQADLLEEASGLAKNIDHIKQIVAMQQSYAKVSGVLESLPVAGLVEDALQMNAAAFQRHGIEVIRHYQEVPEIMVDKHKILQILLNLIRNAKYAIDDKRENDKKRLVVGIGLNGNNRVKITVQDNGVGIKPEDLTRIFAHGFTTKKDGHGFGLHLGALSAKEMGGSLIAHSDGPGRGALFILELPIAKERTSK